MKHKFFYALAFVLIAFSCSDTVENSEVESVTKQILATKSFKSLNIDLSTLDLEAASYVTGEKKSIVIPAKGNKENEGVLGMIKDGKLIHVSYFKITGLVPNEIEQSFAERNFTGTFTIRANGGQIDMQIEKASLKGLRVFESARTNRATEPECGYITTSSGAYGCAGARIENMNWFDKTICYVSFGACFAQEVVSCWLDGCTV